VKATSLCTRCALPAHGDPPAAVRRCNPALGAEAEAGRFGSASAGTPSTSSVSGPCSRSRPVPGRHRFPVDGSIRRSRGGGRCPRPPHIRAAGGSRGSGDRPRGGHPVLSIQPGRRVHRGKQLIHQVRTGAAPTPPGAETHDARQHRPPRPGNGLVTAPAFRCGDPWSNTFLVPSAAVEEWSLVPGPPTGPGALCNPFRSWHDPHARRIHRGDTHHLRAHFRFTVGGQSRVWLIVFEYPGPMGQTRPPSANSRGLRFRIVTGISPARRNTPGSTGDDRQEIARPASRRGEKRRAPAEPFPIALCGDSRTPELVTNPAGWVPAHPRAAPDRIPASSSRPVRVTVTAGDVARVAGDKTIGLCLVSRIR
jgi:hypothetical protein